MIHNKEARKSIKNAVNIVTDAVQETFGVFGNTVVIPTTFNHAVTKDGVSVLNAIQLENEYENIIVNILKESALRTNKAVGDGSTTFTILTRALYNEALKHIENGAHPIDIKKGMEKAVEAVIDSLDEMSTKITTPEQLASIARISANNDESLGNLIGDLFNKIGVDGVSTIEPSTDGKTYTDVIQGMSYDKGWFGPIYANNKSKMLAEYSDVHILICDYAITNVSEIIPILNYISTVDVKPLLLICDDLDYNVQSTLNQNMGAFNLVVTKAPYFQNKRYMFLEDLAIYTGAKLFSKETNDVLENFSPEDLGSAEKIVVSNSQTLIVKSSDDPRLEERALAVEKETQDDFTKARLANLRGKLGVVYIGANTDVEFKEKYDRVEDALNATRASLEEGFIIGGGNSLVKISKKLKLSSKNEDEQLGINAVLKAIQIPFKTILKNAGQESQYPLSLVDAKTTNKGYSVREKMVKDLVEEGIIDPVKVTKYALRNANSVATQLLMTNVIIK